jgi:hypothetical protein
MPMGRRKKKTSEINGRKHIISPRIAWKETRKESMGGMIEEIIY